MYIEVVHIDLFLFIYVFFIYTLFSNNLNYDLKNVFLFIISKANPEIFIYIFNLL